MIPEDWESVSMEDICSQITDGTHFTPTYVENGIPFLSVENVTNNNFSKTKYISPEDHFELCKRCKPQKGDILLTRIGSLGVTKYINWDINASIYVSLTLLRVKDGIDQMYVYQYTKSKDYQDEILRRSLLKATPQKINLNEIGKTLIRIPQTVKEQSKIASILSTVDDKIDSINERIKETQKLKQGLMQQLLTRGIGHTRFKDSPLGEIPESWEVVKIGDHQDLMTNGFVGTATKYYVDIGGILYIQGYNVQENKFRHKGIKYISTDFHEKHKKSHLKEGDLLTVQTGHIGTTVVVPKELEGANCHALIITRLKKKDFDPQYISFFLNSGKGKDNIKVISVGSTLAHINVGDFMKFLVPKPTLIEQQEISGVLSEVGNKLDVLQEQKNEYEQLKKGLMQQLLTGKMRVKLDN